MTDPTKELIFQNEVVAQMVAGGWKRGNAAQYDRALALYPEDVLGFVQCQAKRCQAKRVRALDATSRPGGA